MRECARSSRSGSRRSWGGKQTLSAGAAPFSASGGPGLSVAAGAAAVLSFGPPINLGNFGPCCAFPTDINDLGQVAGFAATERAGGGAGLVIWDAARGMRPIPERPGFVDVRALAINNRGQVLVADWSPTVGFVGSGFVWEEGRPPVPIGPYPPGVRAVEPADINDRGQVVGQAYAADGSFHALLWEPGAGMTLLPPPPGGHLAFATALSDRGHVVGIGYGPELVDNVLLERAVRWTPAAAENSAPAVDRLHAVVLPPGVVPGLSGVWLRVRLTDEGDAGPWDWRIDWGDGTVHTPTDVQRTGEFAFLRAAPYTAAGPHTISVTATDPGGLMSAAVTVRAQ